MSVQTCQGLYLESIPELAYFKYLVDELEDGIPIGDEVPYDFRDNILGALFLELDEFFAEQMGSKEDKKAHKWLNERVKYNPLRFERKPDYENAGVFLSDRTSDTEGAPS